MSPISFSMLSGAGLIKGTSDTQKIRFHQTTAAIAGTDGKISLKDAMSTGEVIDFDAPLFVMGVEKDGSLTGAVLEAEKDGTETQSLKLKTAPTVATAVMVDYYVQKAANKVSELQIDMEHFGGYYYVEADTLFRDQNTGMDMPANLTFPNVKIQSNFTFSMASTGDPSTFTFTMDAMPGYTYFDQTKKVLCAIQIADDTNAVADNTKTLFSTEITNMEETQKDSIPVG